MGFWKQLFIGFSLVLCAVGDAPNESKDCSFPAIYNFGDSASDTGSESAAFGSLPLPYGETFFHKPAGRACDGRLLIDFLAERLRLPYLSAYLNSLGSNYRHGANFAVGGATIRRQNASAYQYGISPFSLAIQIKQFDDFKSHANDLYKQAKTTFERSKLPVPEEFSKALYTLDIGNNDLYVGFQTLSLDQLHAAIPDMINQFVSAVQHLYQQGGRAFWIHNRGPVGCAPVNQFYHPHPPPGLLDKYGCVIALNEIAAEFNKQLKVRVIKLRAELSQASITYVDTYTAAYALIRNHEKEGFKNMTAICCGYHVKSVHVPCGAKTSINGSEVYGAPCKDPSKYISWDGVHSTEASYHWLANHILNGSLSDPPVPITQACHKHYNKL
ncbi:GDSL esterase/lipase family [Quillaja saponaria]|uniref:GDSL esterase/lipase family n=1 Tax=Quillaja saponaria TaxID=32244 RepID=A0AAD7Q4K4_QUISA|nr:GDSL esterase/lipase family [Quillaja saponaria]